MFDNSPEFSPSEKKILLNQLRIMYASFLNASLDESEVSSMEVEKRYEKYKKVYSVYREKRVNLIKEIVEEIKTKGFYEEILTILRCSDNSEDEQLLDYLNEFHSR